MERHGAAKWHSPTKPTKHKQHNNIPYIPSASTSIAVCSAVHQQQRPLHCQMCADDRPFAGQEQLEIHYYSFHFHCLPYRCEHCADEEPMQRHPTEKSLRSHYQHYHGEMDGTIHADFPPNYEAICAKVSKQLALAVESAKHPPPHSRGGIDMEITPVMQHISAKPARTTPSIARAIKQEIRADDSDVEVVAPPSTLSNNWGTANMRASPERMLSPRALSPNKQQQQKNALAHKLLKQKWNKSKKRKKRQGQPYSVVKQVGIINQEGGVGVGGAAGCSSTTDHALLQRLAGMPVPPSPPRRRMPQQQMRQPLQSQQAVPAIIQQFGGSSPVSLVNHQQQQVVGLLSPHQQSSSPPQLKQVQQLKASRIRGTKVKTKKGRRRPALHQAKFRHRCTECQLVFNVSQVKRGKSYLFSHINKYHTKHTTFKCKYKASVDGSACGERFTELSPNAILQHLHEKHDVPFHFKRTSLFISSRLDEVRAELKKALPRYFPSTQYGWALAERSYAGMSAERGK